MHRQLMTPRHVAAPAGSVTSLWHEHVEHAKGGEQEPATADTMTEHVNIGLDVCLGDAVHITPHGCRRMLRAPFGRAADAPMAQLSSVCALLGALPHAHASYTPACNRPAQDQDAGAVHGDQLVCWLAERVTENAEMAAWPGVFHAPWALIGSVCVVACLPCAMYARVTVYVYTRTDTGSAQSSSPRFGSAVLLFLFVRDRGTAARALVDVIRRTLQRLDDVVVDADMDMDTDAGEGEYAAVASPPVASACGALLSGTDRDVFPAGLDVDTFLERELEVLRTPYPCMIENVTHVMCQALCVRTARQNPWNSSELFGTLSRGVTPAAWLGTPELRKVEEDDASIHARAQSLAACIARVVSALRAVLSCGQRRPGTGSAACAPSSIETAIVVVTALGTLALTWPDACNAALSTSTPADPCLGSAAASTFAETSQGLVRTYHRASPENLRCLCAQLRRLHDAVDVHAQVRVLDMFAA